ncbi:MAG: hypothetical protein JSU70_07675 [Phycisphaerales bacterium]|nr:MAG: hypothetical protein JSU70_07675 [Phycisphaerales bacterium]
MMRDVELIPGLLTSFAEKVGGRPVEVHPIESYREGLVGCHLTLVLGVGLLLFAGCGTRPIVAGPCHFGVGFYQVDSKSVNPAVDHYRIQGVGALCVGRRFSLGYADHQWVHACVEGRSYRARTRLVDFAVGEEAEKAGIEFLFHENSVSERSE